MIRNWFTCSLLATALMSVMMSGCGSETVTKTEDPATIEQKRQEHQQMSQRERMGP